MKLNLTYLLLASAVSLSAQGITPDILLKPPADTWPAYHGDYSGRRHSSLAQITPENVRNLGLSWAFQTGVNQSLKCSPLLVDGVLYITTFGPWTPAPATRSGNTHIPKTKASTSARAGFRCMATGSIS